MRLPRRTLAHLSITFAIGLALHGIARPLSAQARAANSTVAAHGTVRGDAFLSDALGVTKHLMVYLPPSYDRSPKRRYPVVYYLHGLGGRETDWLSVGGIDAVADSL